MGTVQLDLNADLVTLLGEVDQPIERAVLEMIVLELFRRRTISSGKAAELLGIDRYAFVRHAADLGIPFFALSSDEWAAEVQASDQL